MNRLLRTMLVLIIIVSFEACKAKEEKIIKYISAPKGLNLRESADKQSKSVSILPFGTEIKVIKIDGNEIFLDDRYGQWMNVEASGKIGWVFSGFASDFEPKSIQHTVANYYREKYKKLKNNLKEANPEMYKEYTEFKDDEVNIVMILDNYVLLTIPTNEGGGVAKENGNVVWKYSSNEKQFKEVFFNEQSAKAILFYLNDDKFPDLIAKWGCCDSGERHIYFGTPEGLVEHKKISCDGYDDDENYPEKIGRCGDTDFACYDGKKQMKYYYKFNCSTNTLEIVKEKEIKQE